ncbi:MAG TPA: LppP/LprE family lipoprotein [Conexibacter sp.]|nr:LppP/LprE family lipoprotein [Conexibacter sp.]
MPSRRRILSALAPAALALLVLAGCGGDDEPTSASVATPTVTKTVTVPATTPTTSTGSTTPTDPNAPLSLQAAEQVLDARGYAPLGERDWRPDQQLKVLLGVSRSADPRAEQAFFFVGDAFIGTDTKDPSAAIELAAQSDDSVTLSYGLYRPADQIDVPTGGTAEVTYRWDGSSLAPQDPIPSASTAAPLSRR